MTPTEFCKLVENRLGWMPPVNGGWKTYTVEAAKVKRKVATNPELYTWPNLVLAVELLAKEKKERTPVGVFSHVERARDLALDPEHAVERDIQAALGQELASGDPDGWVTRFARASGSYRAEALKEWRQARGRQVQR